MGDEPNQCVALVAEQLGDLFLEEYRFRTRQHDLSTLINALVLLIARDDAQAVLKRQLVLVSDDMFAHLAQHTTPVNAHIAIDSDSKTVREGALWYEETLPPETVLYVPLSASSARNGDKTMDANAVLKAVTQGLLGWHPWLQLGGNETVGMGWCAVKIIEKAEG